MKGKNEASIFLPLKLSSSGLAQYVKGTESICLTSDQARCIYKEVEKDDLVNVEMIKQEIEEDRLDKDNEIKEKKTHIRI